MSELLVRRPFSPARTGVWVGIAAITMSFAAYTSAMVVRQGAAADWQHIHLPPLLYLNTLILLVSSVTLELGGARVRWSWVQAASDGGPATGHRTEGLRWLDLTLALGLLFLAGQLLVWQQLAGQGLYLATSPNSSFLYVFTVLHALHLLGGIVALGYVLHRIRAQGAEPPDQALGAAALYWHFMAVLWLYLLLVLALRL
jgi:cytochrome c oxidase subunit III